MKTSKTEPGKNAGKKRIHEFKIHKSWPWYSQERLVEVSDHHFVKACQLLGVVPHTTLVN